MHNLHQHYVVGWQECVHDFPLRLFFEELSWVEAGHVGVDYDPVISWVNSEIGTIIFDEMHAECGCVFNLIKYNIWTTIGNVVK